MMEKKILSKKQKKKKQKENEIKGQKEDLKIFEKYIEIKKN